MSITINCRKNHSVNKNIKTEFININELKLKEIYYKNKPFIYINLNSYKNIDIECDGYEKMSETCVKNGFNKYVLFKDTNNRICVQINNFETLSIIYHYRGYKWRPGNTCMNAHIWNVINVDERDFDDDDVEDTLFVPF
jgi:hypothetical protein